jgi:hypothetical protein
MLPRKDLAMSTSKWVLTDDDSCQHVRKISDDEFELIELSEVDPETHECVVYSDTVNVTELIKDSIKDVIDVIKGFGYNSVADVVESYGDSASQVIAECVFEYYGFYHANVVMMSTREECEKYITEFTGSK